MEIDFTRKTALKGILHTHSTNSDGILTPEQVLKFYKNAGYGFVSITDHNRLTRVSADDLVTIPGVEINLGRTALGYDYHVVIIGLEEMPSENVRRGIQELIDWAKSQDLFVFIAHPYWSMLSMEDLLRLERYDAIEVFNTGCEVEISRGYSGVYWDYLLHAGRSVFGVAVDDTHHYSFDALGGWVVASVPEPSALEVLKSLKGGNFYSSSGPEIKRYRVERTLVEVESTKFTALRIFSGKMRGIYFNTDFLKVVREKKLEFVKEFVESGEDGVYSAHARLEGGITLDLSLGENFTKFKIEGNLPLEKYVRIEVIDEKGRAAWLNPVRI